MAAEADTLERELAAMTACVDHIGSSLAVVTAERDTLRRDHNGCALWAEGSRRERDKLKAELAAMTAERDALVQTCGELCPHCGWRGLRGDPEQCAFCQNAKLSADLYNMTAAKELAERQVAVLCKRIAELMYQNECPTGEDCEKYKDCSGCWAAWARAEAVKEGGKG